MPRLFSPAWPALSLAACLSACGGGGSDNAAATSSAAAPGTSAVMAADNGSSGPTSTVVADAANPADCGLPDFNAEVLRQVNAQRARGAFCGSHGAFPVAAALSWHGALATAAAVQARDMAAGGFLSHTGSDGRSVDQRISAAGYGWRTVAENVAFGYPDISAVVAGWMASDGHCANLMNAQLRDLGMACARAPSGQPYWVMDLALRR